MRAARVKFRADPGQVAATALLLLLAGGSWVITGRLMAGMDNGPGTDLGSLGFFVSAWVLMMAR